MKETRMTRKYGLAMVEPPPPQVDESIITTIERGDTNRPSSLRKPYNPGQHSAVGNWIHEENRWIGPAMVIPSILIFASFYAAGSGDADLGATLLMWAFITTVASGIFVGLFRPRKKVKR